MTKICSKHGPYEVQYRDLFGTQIEIACPQCIEDEERETRQEQEQQEQAKRQRAFEQAMSSKGIPRRYWQKGLKDFAATECIDSRDMDAVRSYVHNQEEVSRVGRSLLFYGPPGTGKTHLALSILKIWKGGGFYTTARKYTRELRNTYSGEGREQDVIDRFVRYDLLVIDEIGKQFDTPAEKWAMFDLINERYNELKPTIFISNLSIEDFTEFMGEEAVDRIRENRGFSVLFDGRSYRRKGA